MWRTAAQNLISGFIRELFETPFFHIIEKCSYPRADSLLREPEYDNIVIIDSLCCHRASSIILASVQRILYLRMTAERITSPCAWRQRQEE